MFEQQLLTFLSITVIVLRERHAALGYTIIPAMPDKKQSCHVHAIIDKSDISGHVLKRKHHWEIAVGSPSRRDGGRRRHQEFDGLGDTETLDVEDEL